MQIHWAGGVHTELKVRKNKGGHTANATDDDVVELVRELALPKGKAEAVIAALSISNVADAEDALSAPLNSAEAIYRANLDMKGFHQEVVRVVLLDTQNRCITKMDIARGTVNQSLAHPREIFRPAIIHSAYAFVIVHNHPSGTAKPSEADLQITKRVDVRCCSGRYKSKSCDR